MGDERGPSYKLKTILAMCVRFNFLKSSIYVIDVSTTYLNIMLSLFFSFYLSGGSMFAEKKNFNVAEKF